MAVFEKPEIRELIEARELDSAPRHHVQVAHPRYR